MLAAFVVLLGLAAGPAQAQTVIYVDKDANGADNGNSWTDAYTDLQTALSDASTGDSLWVAEGTYTPSSSDNTISFTVSGTKDGLAIYGGFDGTETQLSDRDPSAHTTTLSGDIDGDDDPIAPDTDSDNDFNTPSETDHINGTNSEHVVRLTNGVTRSTILDGLTIQGGQANSGGGTLLPDETGGGLFCDARGGSCSPTLRNLTFKGNVAAGGGGGALSTYADGGTANPLIVNSTFYANASSAPNSSGGALFIEGRSTESSPVIVSSVFDNNSAGSEGGAIYNYNLAATVDPLIANSVFVNNTAGTGGAIYNRDANPTLTNVTFSTNDAFGEGGAIYNVSGSSPQIQNSILWGNTADGGGAQIYNDGSGVTPTVAHSILEGGLSAISENSSSSTTDNGGNLNADPLFVDAATGDLRLNWASPAIEAGDPTLLPPDDGDVDGDGNTSEILPLDIAGNSRTRGPLVDMGAYEGGAEPSGVTTLRVDSSQTTSGTSGGTWGDAYGTLQAALAAARNEAAAGGTLSFSEIWVTGDTYYPDRGPGIPANTQDTSFVITGNEDGVQLYGGFSGGESTRSARDPETNVTVLSGDVDADNGGADNNKTDGVTPTAADISGNNSHHVLLLEGTVADLTSSTVIDGVTITAGQADGSTVVAQSGGGLVCLANDTESFGNTCSPELRNVAFEGNLAARAGGAIYNAAATGTASPRIQNAVFSGNRAAAGNADDGGGAIYNLGFGGTASPTIVNSVFVNNGAGGTQASNGGGAIYNYADNNLLQGTDGIASPTITNVTFAENDAPSNGGAVFNKSTGAAQEVAPTIENAILWGNAASGSGNQIYNTGGGASQTITHTLLEGGIGAISENNSSSTTDNGGNLNADPLFVDAASGNVRLNWASPAIDAGDGSLVSATQDLVGNERNQGVTVDMGAYEGGAVPNSGSVSTIRVDSAKTTNGGSGDTWGDAYGTLQAALAAARNEAAVGETLSFTEITMAAGTYYPDQGPGISAGKQDTSFVITGNEDGLQLRGGYPSGGGSQDPDANVTVLSGDIDDDDTDPDNDNIIEDTNPDDDNTVENLNGSNAYHVLVLDGGGSGFGVDVGDNVTSNTVLDGVTVTAGNAVGGGAAQEGGGLFCDGGGSGNACSPTIADVTFSGNNAARGGAIYTAGASGTSAPTITGVVFTGNSAINPIDISEGGALFNNEGSPEITDAVFRNNSVKGDGGAIYESEFDTGSGPTITNTLFVGNSSNGGAGGAITGGTMTITNATFTGNSADDGGAIHTAESPTITNSILWGNTASTNDEVGGGTPTFEHSLVQGSGGSSSWDTGLGTDNGGNLDTDPLFVDAASGNVRLNWASPAIDAGDGELVSATQDLVGNERNQGVTVDMGAYEGGAVPNSGSVSTIRVDSAKTTNGASGGTWGDAYGTLQAALAAVRNERAAGEALSFNEVRIAEGVYYPDEGPGITAQNEDASFVVTGREDGLTIKGGYQSGGGARDVETYKTVLSGDIDADNGGADNNKTDGVTPTAADISGSNSRHVLFLNAGTGVGPNRSADVTTATLIDGLTVTAGQADAGSFPGDEGGGVFCDGAGSGNECSPTLQTLTFVGNTANASGGALYANGSNGTSSPTITGTRFTGNTADFGGAIMNFGSDGTSSPQITDVVFDDNSARSSGGALYNEGDSGGQSTPLIENVTFTGNSAASSGGAIYNDGTSSGTSSPTITGTRFTGNTADFGGAIMNFGSGGTSSPQITDVVFDDNSAGSSGGALYNDGDSGGQSSPVIENTVFSSNSTGGDGGAMYNEGFDNGSSKPTITNVTLAGNTAVSDGGAIYNNGTSGGTASPTITNTILWDNRADGLGDEMYNDVTSNDDPVLAHTIIQGGVNGPGVDGANADDDNADGGGNRDGNPQFNGGASLSGDDGQLTTTDDSLGLMPGSPALDAGDNGPVSVSTDITGAARTQDLDGDGTATVNIGAYETPVTAAPTATTAPASSRTSNGFTAEATVNPGGLSTTVTFQFSRNGTFGADSTFAVSASPLDGTFVDESVSASPDALAPATTYQYRVKATNTEGSTTGSPQTVTTDDTTPPQNLTLDSPTSSTFRSPTSTIDVTYSYSDAAPDSVTITLNDGAGNTASFGVDDRGYPGDDTQKSVPLDLSRPKTTAGSGLTTGNTYDISVTAIDAGGETSTATGTDLVMIDAAPTISGGTPAEDNSYVDVTFSEGVYTGSDGTGAVTTGDLTASFAQNGGAATGVSIDGVETTGGAALSGGETTIRVQISVVDGPATGEETIEIQSADGSSIYDDVGNALGADQTTGTLSLNNQFGSVVYVDPDATGAANGSSWTDAFPNLQDALRFADADQEIWIAEGVYYPDEGENVTADDPDASFTITGDRDGLKIYGGFEGAGEAEETQLSQRDVAANPTVLSGDVEGNDPGTNTDGIVGDVDPNEDFTPENLDAPNSDHVLYLDGTTGGDITTATVIDGVTVTAGWTSSNGDGGGLYCDGASGNTCSPTLNNVTFSGNYAEGFGGAIYNNGDFGTSSPTITSASFRGNEASQGGAMYNWGRNSGTSSPQITGTTFTGNRSKSNGGAINNDAEGGTSTLVIEESTFNDNTAGVDNVANGGALFTDSSSPTIRNTTFSNNLASGRSGGAIYNRNGDPTIMNVVFIGNVSTYEFGGGGAIFNGGSGGSQITNATFVDNEATQGSGGAIYNEGSPTITNTILWHNRADIGGDEIYNASASATLSHTIVQDGDAGIANGTGFSDGTNNLDRHPRFEYAPLPAGDDGTYATNDDGLHLTPESPALDAGDDGVVTAGTDLTGASRIQNGTVDIGAYEGARDQARTIYVDEGATGAGDGTSWADADPTLQDTTSIGNGAFSYATSNDEIRIAEGVYTPAKEDTSFTIAGAQDSLEVYGGYASGGGSRNPQSNVTVLSGDVDGDDGTNADGVTERPSAINGPNSHHVLFLNGGGPALTPATVIDGLTVTAGQADGASFPSDVGGGIYCEGDGAECSPALTNVVFAGNTATRGGALFNHGSPNDASSPHITGAVFSENTATTNGGAIYNDGESAGESDPTIEGTFFVANRAGENGGAVYNTADNGGSGSPVITNTVFANNQAGIDGGAMANSADDLSQFSQSLIDDPDVDNGTSSPKITNATFAANQADRNGGAIANIGLAETTTDPQITNTILWGSVADANNDASGSGGQIHNDTESSATVNYTIVEGGDGGTGIADGDASPFSSGTGNLNQDPLFNASTPLAGPDGTLATGDDSLNVTPGSPVLDAGFNDSVSVSADITGAARTQDLDGNSTATVNIGAYETPVTAAPTATTGPASDVTDSGFTAEATVNPGGLSTTVTFQFSRNGTFGPDSTFSVPASPLSGPFTEVSVSASPNTLDPATTYQYRVKTTNTEGTAVGSPRTVSTDDTTPPQNLTVDSPSATVYKQSSASLEVTYSYADATPDTVTITLDDGTNTASFGVNDSSYPGDNTQKATTLDLTSPKAATNSGIVPGNTYDLTLKATDDSTNTNSVTQVDRVTIDDTVPSISTITRFSPTSDSTNNTSVSFKVSFSETVQNLGADDFALGSNPDEASISGIDVSASDTTITVSGIGGEGALGLNVSDGDGDVTDRAGNVLDDSDPPVDETYVIDRTAPSISNVSLAADDSDNLQLSLESNEPLDLGGGVQVTVNGPTSGTDWATFTGTDFSKSGSGPYTYTTTRAYSDGEGTYRATVDAAVDPAGNDGAEGKSDTYFFDTTPPQNLTVDRPSAVVYKQSDDSVEVGYSYDEIQPDTMTVTLGDGTNTASFGVDDSDYPGDDTQKTVRLDLSSPNTTTNSGVVPGNTYDISLTATDDSTNTRSVTKKGVVKVDDTPPTISDVQLGTSVSTGGAFRIDTNNDMVLRITASEKLGAADTALTVSIDGPNTANWKSFSRGEFAETVTDQDTVYTLTTSASFSDGPGRYTAVVGNADDLAGNDGPRAGSVGADSVRGVTLDVQADATLGTEASVAVSVGGGLDLSGKGSTRRLSFREGGAGSYRDTALTTVSDDSLRATLPASVVTPRGIDYYITLSTQSDTLTVPAGGEARARTKSLHLPVFFENLSPNNTETPITFPAGEYRMVSVPGEPTEGIKAALREAYGAYDTTLWRVLQWSANSEADGYREYPALDTLRPGQGFWLVTRGGTPPSVSEGQTVKADSAYRIPLKAGWNQIGTPFGFGVPWSAVRDSSGLSDGDVDGPFAYREESYETDSLLSPWEGHFLYSTDRDTLVVPPVGAPDAQNRGQSLAKAFEAAGAQTKSSESGRTTLRVEAASKSGREQVQLGLWPGAKDGRDGYDQAKPPSVEPGLELAAMEKVGDRAVPHAGSAKPVETASGGTGQSWRLRLSAPEGKKQKVKLFVKASGADRQVYLLDLSRERRVLRGAELALEAGETRALKAIVGTRAYAETESQGIDLDGFETKLRGTYPNPFADQVTIEYVLSEAQEATIEVYDVLGRKVRTLAKGEKEAGVHRLRWDGKSRQGVPVGSGMYFLRLRAKDKTQTKKIVRVR